MANPKQLDELRRKTQAIIQGEASAADNPRSARRHCPPAPTGEAVVGREELASTPRQQRGRGKSAHRSSAPLPEGISVEDTGRKSRSVRLMRISCESCGWERTVPKPVVQAIHWPYQVDAPALDEALEGAFGRAALLRVQTLASTREYGRVEMSRRLMAEGFGEESVNAALERAEQYGWIDDGRYARVFVSNKRAAGWGEARIAKELRFRGVSESVIDDALAGGEDGVSRAELELERARQQLSRHPVHGDGARAKLFRRLISKGYSSSVASQAVHDYLEQQE